MKFSIVAAFTGLVALVSAVPQYGQQYTNRATPAYTSSGSTTRPTTYPSQTICLTSSDASNLVNKFSSLLTNYSSSVADAYLSDNFTDTSSSINMLAGYPLDAVTFPSKAAFKAGQGSLPPIPFTLISIDDVTCTNVTFRWSTTVVKGGLLVKGINSFVASNKNNSAAGWQIKTMYSEFNAWAWAKNVGQA